MVKQDDIAYEEPDLSGAVEGVDYTIAYGVDDVTEEQDPPYSSQPSSLEQ